MQISRVTLHRALSLSAMLGVGLAGGCVVDARLGALDGGGGGSGGSEAPLETGDSGDSGDSGAEAGDGMFGDDGSLPPGIEPVSDTNVILDCDLQGGYEVSSWRATEPSSPRLWIGGVYQTRGDHSGGYHPEGSATVSWGVPGRNVLVLGSYEPTQWTITVEDGAELELVVVTGYHDQRVVAPPDVAVEIHTYENGASPFACGYSLPGDGGGCEGEELVAFAQQATGLSMYAFDGCYDATTFRYAE